MPSYIIPFFYPKTQKISPSSKSWMFRPADLRRESTNMSCDPERAFLQITTAEKGSGGCCFAGPPLDGTLGSRKSPSWLWNPWSADRVVIASWTPPGSLDWNGLNFPLLSFLFSLPFFSSVQFSRSVMSDSVTTWTAACQASLSITNSQSLLKLTSIQSVMPSNHLILCRPLLLPPSIFPSIRVFSNESAFRIKWPNIGVSASTSVLPMNIQDWFPLGWTGWIPLLFKGLSRIFSNITVHCNIKKRGGGDSEGTGLSLRNSLSFCCLKT